MFILSWVAFFFILWLFFHFYGKTTSGDAYIQHGQLVIEADARGHYQVAGKINGKPVQFMLDTGATTVAVPASIAEQMDLHGNYPITIQTASGQETGLLTRLNSLSFGKFELQNVKAVIIPSGQNTVLMGMNVLKRFDIRQEKGRLLIKSV